jgi:hypothetical protein
MSFLVFFAIFPIILYCLSVFLSGTYHLDPVPLNRSEDAMNAFLSTIVGTHYTSSHDLSEIKEVQASKEETRIDTVFVTCQREKYNLLEFVRGQYYVGCLKPNDGRIHT